MLIRNIILLSISLLYSSFSILICQTPNLKFEHISVEDGLSHTKVFCIYQDHKGFVWFGTEDGLNKFDGYKFKVYRHNPADSSTVGKGAIRDIYEDLSGNLWIATNGGGINWFVRETESFTRFTYDRKNPASIQNNFTSRITSFRYENKEIFWIGTAIGMFKFNPESERFAYLPHTDKGYPSSFIEAMVVDSAGKVWIGTIDGLYCFDAETGKYSVYRHNPDNPFGLNDNRINALYWDKSGILWIGTENGGLNKFDPQNNKFISYRYDPNDQQTVSSNWIISILEDRSGTLWLGTAAGGLNILDRRTEKFTAYMHDSGDLNSISDNTVMRIFEDKSGVLWVATWDGVNKIDPSKSQFIDIKEHPGNSNGLSGSFIWSICKSNFRGKPTIWIGTKTNSLNELDLTSDLIKHYLHDPDDPNSIPSNYISSLYEDHSGLLWIGTYGEGLIRYNRDSKNFFRYEFDPDDPNSISGNHINCIFQDSSGLLWIGTQSTGLNRFDKKTNQFNLVGPKRDILNVYQDRSGTLWIAGNLGLKKLDSRNEHFTTYKYSPDDSSSISSNLTTVIYESSENDHPLLWVGTNGGGLNRFDPESGRFKNYTINDGLPSNIINGILEDNDRNLWLSTNNGLSKFNPKSAEFRNYDIADGLLSNKFNLRVCCKTADGQMFFGSTKGLNAFYPDRLKDNPHLPEIVITDFQIFNKPVRIKKNKDVWNSDNYLLEKHISELSDIELSYRENVFSFEFAALDFHSPQKNQYAYKMEGVDPEWVLTDASHRFATYTNLDPGEYTFRVKGSNNDGVWNEEGISLRVNIIPPWWETNLAYTFYILLLVFIVFITWHLQLRRIHLRQQMQMEHFEAEKLREVDQLKSRFFANISHEFRTPLTLIKGPLRQLLNGEFAGNIKETYKMMSRNSDRLLGLINQILDLSKLESGEMKLKVAETDVVKFIKGMVLSFSPLAETKKVIMKFSSAENSMIGYFDCDKLEKIVTNLLANAFRYTPEGGEVEVTVTSPTKLGEDGPDLSGSGGVINESLSYPSPHPFPYPRGCCRLGVEFY